MDRWPWIRIPLILLSATLLLVLLGWASIARAEEIANSGGRFLRQQMVWSVLALVVLIVASLPSYRLLARWTYAGYGVVCLLLIAVYFFPAVNGAHRWLRFGGVGFQPSELAKIVFVITLARYLMFRKDQRTWRGFVVPFLMAMLPALLIVREPDLGTSLVFFPVLLLMLFWAGARKADLVKVALAGLVIAPLLWTQMSREQQSRVTALFQQTVPGQQPHDDAYHLRQAKRMLTHGGLWGSYFNDEGIPDSAAYHLPEAHTDFVFCMIGERFGLGGTGLVVALWGILVWRALAVAEATREPFGRLLAAGIAGLFGVEVVINLAMTVGLAPITGLALPMVSYGGSALLAHATAIGLLINVAARPGYEISREPFRFATV